MMVPAGMVRWGAMLGLLAAAVPVSAAGYVTARSGWLALTPEAKAAYAQGLNDSLNFVFVDDPLVDALAKRARTRCLTEQQITAARLAATITEAYGQERFAGMAPAAVYILRVGEVCQAYINAERLAFGLGPQ